MDSVLNLSIKFKKVSMDPFHDSGPWTLSKEGVYGPLVHVLSSPVLNSSLLTPNFSLNSLFLHFYSARQFGCLANFSWGVLGRELMTICIIRETGHITSFLAYCICYCSVLLGLKRCT